jgi:hypothetical protein
VVTVKGLDGVVEVGPITPNIDWTGTKCSISDVFVVVEVVSVSAVVVRGCSASNPNSPSPRVWVCRVDARAAVPDWLRA